MRKSTILYLIFFAIILIAACKKETPVEIKEDPVFYFSGAVDGSPVKLNAGENDYYMYSSYLLDTNSVYNFLADLKQINCTNCINRIQVQINDFRVSSPAAGAVIDTSLLAGYYPYQLPGGAPTSYNAYFTATPSNDSSSVPSSYLWDFGDGTTSAIANPAHVFSHSGIYTVCLTISYLNSCTSTICNPVKVGVAGADFNAAINAQSSPAGNTVSLTSTITGGTAPFTYSWDMGDGNTFTTQNVTHTYLIANNYKACLQATDANGYIANTCSNISTQNFPGCSTNYNFMSDTTGGIPNPNAFSNVIIKWTDNSGLTYSSNNSSQPVDSYFQIVSSDSYLNNQNNETTKKLHVKFKCKVFNGSNSHTIDNGEAVIAVAYK